MIDNLKARLRQAAAWPIYLIYLFSLILDFTSAALGRLAACVAGDDWARPDHAISPPSRAVLDTRANITER